MFTRDSYRPRPMARPSPFETCGASWHRRTALLNGARKGSEMQYEEQGETDVSRDYHHPQLTLGKMAVIISSIPPPPSYDIRLHPRMWTLSKK